MVINYLHLLSYCPPERVLEFKQAATPFRMGLSAKQKVPPAEFFAQAVPEACRRIVAFHQGTRSPDEDVVQATTQLARIAHLSPQAARLFSSQMARLALLPARAKPKNRLRKSKGCQYCIYPCRYGLFVLTSKPDFKILETLQKPKKLKKMEKQDPLQAAWAFATAHVWRSMGVRQGYVRAFHLGNLAYCLLVHGMSRSRFPYPLSQLAAFQVVNQVQRRAWSIGQAEKPAV